MSNGFMRGALVGVVASALGLGALSELTPMPKVTATEEPAPIPKPAPKPAAESPASPGTSAPAAIAPETSAPKAPDMAPAAPSSGQTSTDAGASPSGEAPVTPAPAAPAAPESAAPSAAPAPVTPAPVISADATPPTAPAAPDTTSPSASTQPEGSAPEIPAQTPPAPAPSAAGTPPADIGSPAPAPAESGAKPEVIELGTKAETPKPIPALPKIIDTMPSVPGAPKPGFANKVPGVIINRPPSDTAAEGSDSAQTGTAPQTETAPAALPADAPALQRYAAAFDNPQGRPVLSVILIDTGGAAVDRVALTDLPMPITFAIDPSMPNAAAAAKLYRDAGREVLILAKGIPADASAQDIATTLEGLSHKVPEAVGIIDSAENGFETDRPLSKKIVAQLQQSGLGLVTYGTGLDAASQLAHNDGLPSARVYRRLDFANESAPKILRYLDRAAFKAAQEGRVVVVGHTTPDTIAALSEWGSDPRARTVAPAPVTAALKP